MKVFWQAKLSALLILLLPLLIGCDEDCNKPFDGGNQEQHYRMYLAEGSPVNVLVLDFPADTLIDSLSLSFSTDELALSPNKSKIFLSNLVDFTTSVIDAYTLEMDTTLPWHGYYHFDVQRNIGLIVQESSLVKIDGITFGQLGTFNLSIQRGDLDDLPPKNWSS